jgi:hypothetical protein
MMGVLPEEKFNLLKDAQNNGWVIGLKAVTGITGIRREIDDLILHAPEAFNIFVLALQRIQAPDRTKNGKDLMNYFQIAGMARAKRY